MKHYSPMFGHPPLAKEANQFPLVKSKEKPRLLQQSTNMMLDWIIREKAQVLLFSTKKDDSMICI